MKVRIGMAVLEMMAWVGGGVLVQHRLQIAQVAPAHGMAERWGVTESDGPRLLSARYVATAAHMTRAQRGPRGEEVKPLAGLGTVLMGAAGFCVWMSARAAGAKDAAEDGLGEAAEPLEAEAV